MSLRTISVVIFFLAPSQSVLSQIGYTVHLSPIVGVPRSSNTRILISPMGWLGAGFSYRNTGIIWKVSAGPGPIDKDSWRIAVSTGLILGSFQLEHGMGIYSIFNSLDFEGYVDDSGFISTKSFKEEYSMNYFVAATYKFGWFSLGGGPVVQVLHRRIGQKNPDESLCKDSYCTRRKITESDLGLYLSISFDLL